MLGDKSPADPCGVGPALHEGALEQSVIEVRDLAIPGVVPVRCRAQSVTGVGFPDEQGVPVGIGVERNRRNAGPELSVVLGDCVD